MYLESLKKLYYQERKRLEDMWIYKQESKLRILKVRKNIAEGLESGLAITQIKGRGDIVEEIKEKMFFDNENSDKIEAHLQNAISHEFSVLDAEMDQELKNAA